MEFVYLGLMYDETKYSEIESKTKVGLSVAANIFQNNLLKGLKQYDGISIYGINSLPVGTWPRQYNDLFLFDEYMDLYGITFEFTKTINLPVVKQLMRRISSQRMLERYIKKHADVQILTYNFYWPYYKALTKLKKKYPSIKIYTIVTDLPNEYGINYEKGLKAKIIDYIGQKSMKSTEISDGFVLLTEQMKIPLKLGKRPYVVVEGFANESFYENVSRGKNKFEIKTIVYTGTLNEEFGARELVDSFEQLNRQSVELHIYGTGNLENYIKEKSEKNRRIKYFGSVSHNKALEAQQNATILVNPRPNNMEFTKYSFPSKTMEYLVSGRPVVAYKLDGMPDEYRDYFYVIEDVKGGMCKALIKALDDTEENRQEMGKNARKFVLKNKNCKKQAEKVIQLMKNGGL